MAIDTLKSFFDKCALASTKGSFALGWGNGAWGGGSNCYQSTYYRLQNGAIPTNTAYYSNMPNEATKQALLNMAASKPVYLAELEWVNAVGGNIGVRSSAMVIDRLVSVAGLSLMVVGEQTTNMPSVALPRYTDGYGVQMMFENYGGSRATVVTMGTVRYTNSDGVADRISQPIQVGISNQNGESANVLMIPLQDGDKGVRSIEGVTYTASGGSNTIPGGIGVTLFKHLANTPVDTGMQVERAPFRNLLNGGGIIELLPGACLAFLLMGASSQTTYHYWSGRLGVISE